MPHGVGAPSSEPTVIMAARPKTGRGDRGREVGSGDSTDGGVPANVAVAERTAACEAAVANSPGNVQLLAALGRLYLEQSRPLDARLQLEAALEGSAGQSKIAILIDLGRVYAALGNLAAAQKHYEQALAREQTPAAYVNLGLLFSTRGDRTAAEQCYDRALSIVTSRPKITHMPPHVLHSTILTHIGVLRMRHGEQTAALRSFEEATSVDPSDVGPIYARACLMQHKGDVNTAAQLFKVRSYFLFFVSNIREIRYFYREMQRTNRESITMCSSRFWSGSPTTSSL
eukprot:SAG31_NODE_1583_length_7828_cov_1.884332_9_plen_286_part_00